MTNSQFLIDGMTWSYSRLKTYDTCPLEFKLKYLDGQCAEDNAFSQFGSLCHEILAAYYNGIIPPESMSDMFISEFDSIEFPYNKLKESYRSKALGTFLFYEDPFAGKNIVDVEQKTSTKIEGLKFVGVMDLVLSTQNGLEIVDHKSHSPFKNEAEKEEFLKQLYVYAILSKQKYGEYPYALTINHFCYRDKYEVVFEAPRLMAVKDWIMRTWDKLYADNEFLPAKPSEFYCKNLCGARHRCQYGACEEG